MLDYLGILLVAAAAVLAVFGKTTDDTKRGLKHLTRFGWLAVSLTLAGAVVQFAITYGNNKEKRTAAMQRDRVRHVALTELRFAYEDLLSPFSVLRPGVAGEPPERAQRLWKGGVFEAFCKLLPSARVANRNDGVRWDVYIERAMRNASDRFEDILTRYSDFLDAETIALVEETRGNVTVRRLSRVSEESASAVTRSGMELPFCGPSMNLVGFQELASTLSKLEQHLEVELLPLDERFGVIIR